MRDQRPWIPYYSKFNRNRRHDDINPRPAGGGGKGPPCGFSQIAPEVLWISLWNFPYLSGQQFRTLC